MSDQQQRQALYRYRLSDYWGQTTAIENALGTGFDSRLHANTPADRDAVRFSLGTTIRLRHQERLKQVSQRLQAAWHDCRFGQCA